MTLVVPTRDRLWDPFRRLVALLVAPTRFYGRYRYTISNPTKATVDASPVDSTLGLPSLQGVQLNSDAIFTYLPTSGAECHIQFLDGNPALPRCVWTAGGGPNPVARVGDQVQSFLPPVTIIQGTVAGSTFVGTLISPTPITGAITEGSTIVSAP